MSGSNGQAGEMVIDVRRDAVGSRCGEPVGDEEAGDIQVVVDEVHLI